MGRLSLERVMNRLKITMTKKEETMKKHLLKTRLLSFAALCGIALTFASCAKDDVAQNPAKPSEEENKNLTTFVAGGENREQDAYVIRLQYQRLLLGSRRLYLRKG